MSQGKSRPSRRSPKLASLLALIGGLVAVVLLIGQVRAGNDQDHYLPILHSPPLAQVPDLIYGVNFISSENEPADETRYVNGLSSGAAWNRWPMYWPVVETGTGLFEWNSHDAVVSDDLAHGLSLEIVLLGTPGFYQTSYPQELAGDPARPRTGYDLSAPEAATPQGLYDPIFSDGSDIPGPGKSINPSNVWAHFVYQVVNRYRPGGQLAQANGWPADQGVTHWEMWNEPDLSIFWDSSLEDYARLLKVGYLSAKQADPDSQVLFAGLANNFQHLTYYDDVLAILDSDPLAESYNYYHDILATHSYFYAWQSWYHVDRAAGYQAARGLDIPIWLNETGVPAWNDYPGPTWDPTSSLRATLEEQAAFEIQSALYARYAGAEGIFHFQLYDACGNQPQGTDFPPHNGELCDENGMLVTDPSLPCAGDANGLFRNHAGAMCFRQHPQPGTARPNLAAYQLLTSQFRGVEPTWWYETADQTWLGFNRPETGQRVVGMWARGGSPATAVISATHSSATLISMDGSQVTLIPQNGVYTVELPPATNQNAFWDPNLYPIGGPPYLLIEPANPGP